MSVLARALFVAAERLRGSESLALLQQIEPVRLLRPDSVHALQLTRLQALLSHAERHVPYYRELFANLGLSSRDIRSFEDFARLPVLTKEIVRERGRDLVREDVPPASLSEHHSGGSTGVPLTFWREPRYMSASTAGTYRNLRQAGWRPGNMVAFFWGWNDRLNRMSRAEFEFRQQIRRMYQFDPFQSGPEAMDRWLRTWSRIRPRVALGYASTIARFAEHAERMGRRLRPVLGTFTTAEKLYPAQREVIQRVLGGPVFDCYGSSEVQNIATECVRGRMHVNADFVVLETDETGRMPDGTAPLLVTSLWNYAMPFIRYRNEDCGTLKVARCDCGSGFPLMDLRIARVSDNFVLPNGRTVHGEFFTHLLYGSEGIESFQFHQAAMDRIILWIVPTGGAGAARERTIRSAVAQVEALAPGLVHVEAREAPSIPLSSAGKHRFTRSDVSFSAGSGARA